MQRELGQATSADGCVIAYEMAGTGPTVLLVDGALCARHLGPSKAMSMMLVGQGFRVVRYDRRGRGGSSSARAYHPALEVGDIAAVLDNLGGEACLWGMSSGGILALMAAQSLPGIRRVAIYEAPVLFDASRKPLDAGWRGVTTCLSRQDVDGALSAFLSMVGMPAPVRVVMRLTPLWRRLRAIAPTLAHDRDITVPYQQGMPVSPIAGIGGDVLVTAGSRSPRWLREGNKALAGLLPGARYAIVDGDDHMVRPARHQQLLTNFFHGP